MEIQNHSKLRRNSNYNGTKLWFSTIYLWSHFLIIIVNIFDLSKNNSAVEGRELMLLANPGDAERSFDPSSSSSLMMTNEGGGGGGPVGSSKALFKNCGSILRETNFGVIMTPNYPKSFPVPIYCRWIIEAKPGKVITLYLTQFYLREGLRATEYAFFVDNSLNVGKRDLGSISFDDGIDYLLTTKPILVLELEIYDAFNIHSRNLDYFLDVFGFNITYQIADKSNDQSGGSPSPELIRRDACSSFKCSFTGRCLVSSDFAHYHCSCFPGFFGKSCEFGPKCDPFKGINDCLNGGTCRYSTGSLSTICKCPDNYHGSHCEKVKMNPNDCISQLGECSKPCLMPSSDEKINPYPRTCNCAEGYRLSEKGTNQGCIPIEKRRFVVSVKVYDINVDLKHLDKPRYMEIKSGLEYTLLSLLRPFLNNLDPRLKILDFNHRPPNRQGAVVSFHFFHYAGEEENMKLLFQETIRQGKLGRYAVDRNFLQFHKEAVLSVVKIQMSDEQPVIENRALSIACLIIASASVKVTWLKDGVPINFNLNNTRLKSMLLPKNREDQFTAILTIEEIDPLDAGVFTCSATDWGFTSRKFIELEVASLPEPIIVPLTLSVLEGDRVIIVCYAPEDSQRRQFGYNWLKNGQLLNPAEEREILEDLYPTGTRLVIQSAIRTATYTCLVSSTLGTVSRQATITVMAKHNNATAFPTCSKERYQNIDWLQTAVNSQDAQVCPRAYKGTVIRDCQLKNLSKAEWLEPNYSGCISDIFAEIKTAVSVTGLIIPRIQTGGGRRKKAFAVLLTPLDLTSEIFIPLAIQSRGLSLIIESSSKPTRGTANVYLYLLTALGVQSWLAGEETSCKY